MNNYNGIWTATVANEMTTPNPDGLPELPVHLETLLARIYAEAYQAGHHATVEGGFIDVHYSDRDTYWLDAIREHEDVKEFSALAAPRVRAEGGAIQPCTEPEVCPSCFWVNPGPKQEHTKRLREAIESECDGLVICEESADAILRYIGFHPAGRIVGGRDIDGVWVMETTSQSDLMPNQQLVRYDEYLRATTPAAPVDLEQFRSLLAQTLPFLRDEADKYEDDGSNEPLGLAREIEALIDSQGGVKS